MGLTKKCLLEEKSSKHAWKEESRNGSYKPERLM